MSGWNLHQAMNVFILILFNSPFISHPNINIVFNCYCSYLCKNAQHDEQYNLNIICIIR
jgi:hypothetical protein